MIKVILNALLTDNSSMQNSNENDNDVQCLDNNTTKGSSTKIINSELYKKVCKILCSTDMDSNDTISKTSKQSYNEAYEAYIDNCKMLLNALGEDDKYIRQKFNDMVSNLVYDKITGGVYDKRYLDAEYS